MQGAVYEIHAAADIATPDRQGTYWYKSGDLAATVTTGAEGQVDEVKFSPTRTQATYDFLKITHDGTKGEVTVTLPLGKYTITEVKAPYGFVLTQQSYTVEFGWDNQKNDIVLAKTIVSHEQDGDKKCSYSIVNVKDASDAHKNGQTLVFENARVLPVPEKPGDKVSKIGVGIYKQDREALTYLPGAVYELYTVDDIYSADGTKLLEAGTKLATSSTTNASGFTWFDVDVPIRGEYYIDPAGPRSTSRENSGRYRIVEITAPAGYLLDSTPVDVEFTYEGSADCMANRRWYKHQPAHQCGHFQAGHHQRQGTTRCKAGNPRCRRQSGRGLDLRQSAAHRARSGAGKSVHSDRNSCPGRLFRSRKHRVQAGAER